jgi:hypothetical protein
VSLGGNLWGGAEEDLGHATIATDTDSIAKALLQNVVDDGSLRRAGLQLLMILPGQQLAIEEHYFTGRE